MIYHSKNKPKYKRRLLTIFLVVLFLFITFGKEFTKRLNNNVFYAVFTARDFVLSPFSNTFSYFKFKKDLETKNDELKNEIKKLETENLTVDLLRSENQSLKETLGLYSEKENFSLAKVLITTPFTPYDTMIISAGKKQVSPGQKAFFGSTLLGIVTDVYVKTASVKLISSPDQKIVVRINDSFDVEAMGIGNLSFKASVPKDLPIEKGYIVSVKDSENPAILGPIEDIVTTDTSTFKEVYFSIPLKLGDVKFVEIKN